MGSKNSKNAKTAKNGADSQPQVDAPVPDQNAAVECKLKHFIEVRVEYEDTGALVETGMNKRLVLNNGETRDVVLGPGAQAGGKYATGKILTSTDVCHVSFPDMYDAEIKPK